MLKIEYILHNSVRYDFLRYDQISNVRIQQSDESSSPKGDINLRAGAGVI